MPIDRALQFQTSGSALLASGDLHDLKLKFADNLMITAKEISTFVYDTPDKWRRICYLGQKTRVPIFKFGSRWAALKTELEAYMRGAGRVQREDRTPTKPKPDTRRSKK